MGYNLEVRLWYCAPLLGFYVTLGLTLPKDAFGIAIAPMMLSVHGRILTAPSIQYKGESKGPINAEWNMIGSTFHEGKPMPKWSYLCVGRATLPDASMGQFIGALARCGMGNTQPSPSRGFRAALLGSGDDDTNDEAIHSVLDEVRKMSIEMLLVILDSPSAAIYARIKYWADTIVGMCLMSSKLCRSLY